METLDSKFNLAENKGRTAAIDIFSKYILPEGWKIIDGPHKRCWDLEIINPQGEKQAIVEVKYRNCSSEKYEDAILTDGKYQNLLSKGYHPFYIAIYEDGHYYIWDLKEVTPTYSEMWCNAVTVISNHKILKGAYHFKFEDAKYTGNY